MRWLVRRLSRSVTTATLSTSTTWRQKTDTSSHSSASHLVDRVRHGGVTLANRSWLQSERTRTALDPPFFSSTLSSLPQLSTPSTCRISRRVRALTVFARNFFMSFFLYSDDVRGRWLRRLSLQRSRYLTRPATSKPLAHPPKVLGVQARLNLF